MFRKTIRISQILYISTYYSIVLLYVFKIKLMINLHFEVTILYDSTSFFFELYRVILAPHKWSRLITCCQVFLFNILSLLFLQFLFSNFFYQQDIHIYLAVEILLIAVKTYNEFDMISGERKNLEWFDFWWVCRWLQVNQRIWCDFY